VAAVRTSRGTTAVRWTVLLVLGVFFVLPLVAMLEFSTRGIGGTRDLDAWRAIGDDPALLRAIWNSVRLAVLTALGMLLLLVPTMTWVHLRLPRLRRLVEFLCLLPLLIPAIVLVVGIAPLYSWVTYFLGNSSLTLTFVYVVLVLPYAFRAIEAGLTAMDLHTLSEAARSLGASWSTVLFRIVVPNVRPAVLSASLLSMALVLGEFTLASLLNFETLQVSINLIGRRDAALSIAVSLAALLFAFVLLLLFSVLAGRRRASVDDEPAALAPAAAATTVTTATTPERTS
jgi:putative spermidine/putrescine transport system permease protein